MPDPICGAGRAAGSGAQVSASIHAQRAVREGLAPKSVKNVCAPPGEPPNAVTRRARESAPTYGRRIVVT